MLLRLTLFLSLCPHKNIKLSNQHHKLFFQLYQLQLSSVVDFLSSKPIVPLDDHDTALPPIWDGYNSIERAFYVNHTILPKILLIFLSDDFFQFLPFLFSNFSFLLCYSLTFSCSSICMSSLTSSRQLASMSESSITA